MRLNPISYIILFFLFISCGDFDDSFDIPSNSNALKCDDLITALLDLNEDSLAVFLNPELADLNLLDQDNNSCLHDNNLKAFSELLNEECDELTASVVCCGCIKTLPKISEVLVLIDSVGYEVKRVLDIVTPDVMGEPLSFSGVHF